MNVVQLEHIRKTYAKGKTVAVEDVSFSVHEGEIFGLIGPDGAGKTSVFRILTTLLLPDSGSASVLGYDVIKNFRNIRHLVGYMPGRFSLYQDLSVEENLRFFATSSTPPSRPIMTRSKYLRPADHSKPTAKNCQAG
jgi:ABC-type multidrug transport system ATPase subunit